MSKVADVFRRPSVLIETPENGIETLASYMNVSIFVIVIGSFFIIRSECFSNANKSKLLT